MKRLLALTLSFVLSAHAEKLTLDQALDKALATDQSIAIAAAEAGKAALEPRSALVRMMPTLTGNAGATRNDRNGSGTTGTSNGVTSNGSASITLDQPLIDLSLAPAIRRGKLISESARLQYLNAIRQTLFAVTTAFYDVLEQERIVAVDLEAVKLAEENVTIADKRAKAGAVTRTDVLRATASLEENRRSLIVSQSTLDLKRNILANILNLGPQRDFILVEPATASGADPDFNELLRIAYAHREDLRATELVIQQQVERKEEIKGLYGPKLGAQLSASSTAASQNRDSNEWQAAFSVRMPFMTGGQRKLDLKGADYDIQQARLSFDQQRKAVQEEAMSAWVEVRTLRETIVALQAQVAAAEQSYKDLQTQYSAGTAKSIDVLAELRSLNAARKDLAVQTLGLQLALKRLDVVSGVFQEQRVQKAMKP